MEDLAPEPEAPTRVLRTSVEKVHQLVGALQDEEPPDEETAQLMSVFRMAMSLGGGRLLPSDPAKLDELLLRGARWAIGLRSDGAPTPATIAELLAGEDEAEPDVEGETT